MDLRRQRIREAQRTGLRNRIRDAWHVAEARADALVVAWEAEASGRDVKPDSASYWQDGEAWILRRLRAGQSVLDPPSSDA